MNDFEISPRQLFQFSLPCLYRKTLWTTKGATLDEAYRLANLTDLETPREGVDFRIAWNEKGIAFWLTVFGKKQSPWCRASKPEDSDGLQIWIDTRNIKTVHRAGRFCHRFYFLPGGDGPDLQKPCVGVLPINRAREPHGPVHENQLAVISEIQSNGYLLQGAISAEALTGFDPTEHTAIGFTYAVVDRERGELTLGPGAPMPYREDPSLWPALELMKQEQKK